MENSDVFAQILENVRASIGAQRTAVQCNKGDGTSDLEPSLTLQQQDTLDKDARISDNSDSLSELSTEVESSEDSEDEGSIDNEEIEEQWPLSKWTHQLEVPEALLPSSSSSEMLSTKAIGSKVARAPPINRTQQKVKPEAGWFDMKEKSITDSVKRDWRLLRLRATYDPKRFYKSFDSTKIPKKFQMGTIIEGTGEFYSSRMTKKERKATLTEELLADIKLKKDRKRRYEALQQERQELARKRKKIRALHKRSKQRPKH